MDKLTKFEKKFNTSRSQWTKAQWREVALHFAGIELTVTSRETKRRGRKTKTPEEIYKDEQNLSAAAFWRDEEKTKKSTPILGSEVFSVSERESWRKLTNKSALDNILEVATDRQKVQPPIDLKKKKPPTPTALTKAIQENQKKMREK